jgi:hypothetical protein
MSQKGIQAIAGEVKFGIIPFEAPVVADTCVDLIMNGNDRPRFRRIEQLVGDYCLELGGSATIFASQIAKLGA